MKKSFSKRLKMRYCLALLLFSFAVSSCGNESVPEPTGNAFEETSEPDSSIVAVADFHYVPLSSLAKDYAMHSCYTINGEWMYYEREVAGTGEDWFSKYIHIDRIRIADEYLEEDYFVNS